MQYLVLAALLLMLILIQIYLSQKKKAIYGISSLIGFSVWNIAFTIVILLTTDRLSADITTIFVEMILIIFGLTLILAITHFSCRYKMKKDEKNKKSTRKS